MSRAIVCDRCGKVSKNFSTDVIHEISAYPYTSLDTINAGKCTLKRDLCDECLEKIIESVICTNSTMPSEDTIKAWTNASPCVGCNSRNEECDEYVKCERYNNWIGSFYREVIKTNFKED